MRHHALTKINASLSHCMLTHPIQFNWRDSYFMTTTCNCAPLNMQSLKSSDFADRSSGTITLWLLHLTGNMSGWKARPVTPLLDRMKWWSHACLSVDKNTVICGHSVRTLYSCGLFESLYIHPKHSPSNIFRGRMGSSTPRSPNRLNVLPAVTCINWRSCKHTVSMEVLVLGLCRWSFFLTVHHGWNLKSVLQDGDQVYSNRPENIRLRGYLPHIIISLLLWFRQPRWVYIEIWVGNLRLMKTHLIVTFGWMQ